MLNSVMHREGLGECDHALVAVYENPIIIGLDGLDDLEITVGARFGNQDIPHGADDFWRLAGRARALQQRQ